MNVVLKEIFCMEWELGRKIELNEHKSFSINIYVGPQNYEISESFTLNICNIDFVRNIVNQTGIFNSNWYLIIEKPDRNMIEQYITNAVSKIEGKDWAECVKKLRLIGQYEFDDYQI